MKKPVCSVPFCYTRKSETISIHSFPNDYNLRQEWLGTILEATGVEWYNIGEFSGICSKHFKTECVIQKNDGRKILKRGSVPSIFEQPQNGDNIWPPRSHGRVSKVTDWVFSEKALSKNESTCKTCSVNLCASQKFQMHDYIPESDIKIKDMIILLVPGMKYSLTKIDIICEECHETLIQCAQFKKTCLLVNSTFQGKLQRYGKRRSPAVIIEDVSLYGQNGIGVNSCSNSITRLSEGSSSLLKNTMNVEDNPLSESITLLDEGSSPALENTMNDVNNTAGSEEDVESNPEITDQILDESWDVSFIPPDSQDDEANTSRQLEVIKNVQDAIVEDNSTDNTTCPETEMMTLSDAECSSVMEGVDNNVNPNNLSENDNSFMQSIPELFHVLPDHGRILSFVQPADKEFEQFINILASNGVNVCQSLNDITDVGKRKRILLLGDTLSSCQICGESFSNTVSRTKHLRTHKLIPKRICGPRVYRHGDLKCGSCLTTLSTQEDIEYHRKIHPQFVCELCGKRSSTFQGLQVHKLVHKESDLICEQCGMLFKSPFALSHHINSHNKENYTCRRCEKIFNSKQDLKDHVKSTHAIDPQNKKGHPKKASSRSKKCGRDHIATRSCERNNTTSTRVTRSSKNKGPYKCHICSKVSPDYVRFVIHMRMHNRSKRFPCELCQRTFKLESRKDQHMEIVHKKSKENMCMICLEQFRSREELEAHVDQHVENIYKCDICGVTFEKDDQLNHHLVTNHVDTGAK
ncbi:unnamed protein product [Phaedon cochleariae]|uniref:Uncharacterized protein n=1 Tax=Phaedon cochleariae TaxID=80249 RepID=A0A9P0GP48_PHACE|nr:unnamed protein product [Phaedon cochleariae]